MTEHRSEEREVVRLRKAQAKAVMPLIGPLLDAWYQVPNDVACMDELEHLSQLLEDINNAMENAE